MRMAVTLEPNIIFPLPLCVIMFPHLFSISFFIVDFILYRSIFFISLYHLLELIEIYLERWVFRSTQVMFNQLLSNKSGNFNSEMLLRKNFGRLKIF